MAINWVGTDSSGTKVPGSFVVESAQACGQNELHSGWTTTQHASTSNNAEFHVGPLVFATTPRWQIYSATVPGGAITVYLHYLPGGPARLQLEAETAGQVTLGQSQSARQPITATPVANC
jgi:hypothetical protein